ncbi:MAG: hypothetical protein RL223_1413 [Pseudomonadota bacterium]|jgi:ectoine hydroxylase-related dioxygenase (phytanoyl-CoA dioxygenase family)
MDRGRRAIGPAAYPAGHHHPAARTAMRRPALPALFPAAPAFLDAAALDVRDLEDLLDAAADGPCPPLAGALREGVPVYDCVGLQDALQAPHTLRALMDEWHTVLADGAGVLVLAGAWADAALVDDVTQAFQRMLQREAGTRVAADHFARAGRNGRVWNALQKLCLDDPLLFARYYANPWLAPICTAWLGPAWQATSQVNCVYPGGAAQDPHRDYHLGFVTTAEAARWPRSAHRLSPWLTLQGAVAHVDMPLDSGPTLLLPHSQRYEPGYLVRTLPDFDACFARRCVQLPLQKGDAVFFNPALMHAAGHNRSTDIDRMANLLQVSSAFGRAMESVDRQAMSLALHPALCRALDDGRLTPEDADRAIAACAEGYAFPTNLDLDPPVGGLAPASPQAVLRQAVAERWAPQRLADRLRTMAAARQA